jgi:hypothetical protein
MGSILQNSFQWLKGDANSASKILTSREHHLFDNLIEEILEQKKKIDDFITKDQLNQLSKNPLFRGSTLHMND